MVPREARVGWLDGNRRRGRVTAVADCKGTTVRKRAFKASNEWTDEWTEQELSAAPGGTPDEEVDLGNAVLRVYRHTDKILGQTVFRWGLSTRPRGTGLSPRLRGTLIGAGLLLRLDRPDTRLAQSVGVPVTKIAAVRSQERGRGWYPKVLRALADLMGTIESDVAMSEGAILAWERADAKVVRRKGKLVFRLDAK